MAANHWLDLSGPIPALLSTTKPLGRVMPQQPTRAPWGRRKQRVFQRKEKCAITSSFKIGGCGSRSYCVGEQMEKYGIILRNALTWKQGKCSLSVLRADINPETHSSFCIPQILYCAHSSWLCSLRRQTFIANIVVKWMVKVSLTVAMFLSWFIIQPQHVQINKRKSSAWLRRRCCTGGRLGAGPRWSRRHLLRMEWLLQAITRTRFCEQENVLALERFGVLESTFVRALCMIPSESSNMTYNFMHIIILIPHILYLHMYLQ